MKALFVTHNRKDISSGIWKKILSQVDALKKLGFKVDFAYCIDTGFCLETPSHIIEKHNSKYRKYFFYRDLSKVIDVYDIVYIRKPHGGAFSLFLTCLLKKLKTKNPQVKVYYEIPTYPYKHELKTLKEKISDLIYDFSFMFFKKYIDEILIIGEKTSSISGIKTRRIFNGVDVDLIKPIPEINVENKFIMVGVANLSYWHGYDRLIKAISKYKGKDEVEFHIVGDTEPVYSQLKLMASELNVSDKIIFHGSKHSDELRNILEKAHVCVDALGRHRSKNNYNSSIKSKEYAALGLPFIKSHIDDAFDDQQEFIYQVSANDDDISIDEIITWRKGLKAGFSIREREYAISNLSWKQQLSFIQTDNFSIKK